MHRRNRRRSRGLPARNGGLYTRVPFVTEPSANARVDEASGSLARAARALDGCALPAFVFAAIVLVLFVLAPHGTRLDYAVFHRAGARYLHGEDLYRSTEFFSFKYAPIAAAFFAPFALLPERWGWLCVNVLSLVLLLRVMRWAASRLDGGARPTRRAVALVLAMTAPYYGHLFWLGQTDGLVLALVVASEALADKRPLASGTVWALACLVKPPFLCLLLVVVLLRQWRRLAGFAAGGAAWLAAGAARYGAAGGMAQVEAWWRTLRASTPDIICWDFNQSAFALVCTYFAPVRDPRFMAAVGVVATAVVVAGLGAVAAVWRGSAARGRFALTGFALYLTAFLSPLGWNTNLLSALPLAVAVAHAATTDTVARTRRAAAGAAVLVATLNCVDLLLLPFHPWEDTAMTLLGLRQYGIAGLVLAAAGLTLLAPGPATSRRSSPSLAPTLT
jgi:alpha-1,2-mannosyltransferase